ncbi:MAG TPA: hypothetical protein VNM37_05815, partial [Candidatus Dormibacteraeota bacterium]|nr:hypothetical protein [Candidatus Dormibacteraeota bacterium]
MLLPPSQWVDLGNPLTAHWLNARLQARYLVLPGLTSPSRWPNLIAPTLRTALPTNMAAALSATSGLSFVTTRRGGQGQWNYDGSDDRHAATQSWTLQDWTVSCWFRSGDTSNQKGMVCLTDTTWSTNSNPAGVFLILNGQALQI